MPKLFIYIIILFSALCVKIEAQQFTPWGDQGNGTYINPVLNSDFSDPDVIRVENKYYMVCSEFHFMGMTIQESDDMVNWRIVGRIYDRLSFPVYNTMQAYGDGSWAPSIRYHNNKYWVYFCTPNEGLFMTNASKPEGPWAPLFHVKNVKGWEDPCPFWDEDGTAYLGRSQVGAGPIIVHKMSEDGTQLNDSGKVVYKGPIAEGTKFYKRNNYYYLSVPEGGVGGGWQTVLRSKNIYGPYEKKIVLETGSTRIRGPHQGAMVDTPDGEWWFYHFQLSGPLGRVLHLQPMTWLDDWPVIGVDIDRNGIGEPVYVWKKPDVGKTYPICFPQSSDEFDTDQLGLQWQWNHNPLDADWSLSQRKGWLCLTAKKAENLKMARNTLTQRVIGYSGEVVTQLDATGLVPGAKAGLSSLSTIFNAIGVENKDGNLFLFFEGIDKKKELVQIHKNVVYLKLALDIPEKKARFYYSFDNKSYHAFGAEVRVQWGNWKGTRIGLFCYNELKDGGVAAFNFIHYKYDVIR